MEPPRTSSPPPPTPPPPPRVLTANYGDNNCSFPQGVAAYALQVQKRDRIKFYDSFGNVTVGPGGHQKVRDVVGLLNSRPRFITTVAPATRTAYHRAIPMVLFGKAEGDLATTAKAGPSSWHFETSRTPAVSPVLYPQNFSGRQGRTPSCLISYPLALTLRYSTSIAPPATTK